MLQFDKRREASCTLLYHGNVQFTINGHVPPGIECDWIEASRFSYGFMGGSPRGLTSTGELMIVNGEAYAKSTDLTDCRYFDVIHGPRFVSQGVCGIAPDAQPSWGVSWKAPRSKSLPIGQLYREIYDRVRAPYALAALVSFGKLHGTALSLPPVYKESMFENKSRYFAFPPTVDEGGMGIVFGLVTDFNDQKHAALNHQLEVAIYQNPFDQKRDLTAHCHTVTVRSDLEAVADLKPEMVDDVLHLLSDTTITRVTAEVFPLQGVQPLSTRRYE